MKRKPPKFILYAILIFLLAVAIFGCNTEKKALSKTQLYLFKHPEFSAGYCAEQFPDKPDSVIIKTDTLIEIATMDSLVYDTILLNHDTTLIRTIVKTQKIYIKRDSIIYRENRAEQERLQLALFECQKNAGLILQENNNLKASLATWRKTANIRWWWIALLIGGFVGTIAIKIFGKPKIV